MLDSRYLFKRRWKPEASYFKSAKAVFLECVLETAARGGRYSGCKRERAHRATIRNCCCNLSQRQKVRRVMDRVKHVRQSRSLDRTTPAFPSL